MSQDPDAVKKTEARRRLMGRALIILLGLLVLAYAVPLFIPR